LVCDLVARTGWTFDQVDALTLEEVAGMRKAWEYTPPLPVSAMRMLLYFGLHEMPEPPEEKITEEQRAAMRQKLAEIMRKDAAMAGCDQIMEVLNERK
jgi:hypothetical protein